MNNNPMMISFSQNSSTPNSESMSITNQTQEHSPMATPPSKKPRGRPRGSKNKPKPKPNSTLDGQPNEDTSKNPVVVNVPPSMDVIEHIVDVACRGHVSFTVLSATGDVDSVTLCHQAPSGPQEVALVGPFTLIALNGYYIHDNQCTHYSPPGSTPHSDMNFGINLYTSDGEVFGGVVSGKVVAASTGIQVALSTFKKPGIYTF